MINNFINSVYFVYVGYPLPKYAVSSIKLAKEFSDSIDKSILADSANLVVHNGIPIISFKSINIIIVHPFWNHIGGHYTESNSLVQAISMCSSSERIFYADTFNLIARSERKRGKSLKFFLSIGQEIEVSTSK